MRIKAKWNGKCFECGGPVQKGSEIEYFEKHAYHPACFASAEEEAESAPPSREAYALADRLGFRHFSWVDLLSLSGPAVDEPGGNYCPARDSEPIRGLHSEIKGEN